MSKTIKEKKYYRVGETFSNTDKDYHGLLDVPFGIWITTQIVEASLDIDFDMLYTEMSTLPTVFLFDGADEELLSRAKIWL